MALPSKVKVVEVGPRDGLQNELITIATATKVELINRLSACGLPYIEATSFVSAHKIPQLADSAEAMATIQRKPDVTYAALAPNVHGLENAIAAQVEEVGFFTTVSETFCHKNINCSIAESLERLKLMRPIAQKHNIRIRGYISCALGCPYEGSISFKAVANLATMLLDLGCYEISLGDTIGIGTANKVEELLATVLPFVPLPNLAVHFHDTYGQALTNIYAALNMGIHTVDSSVAGLGGCPYAKGASGNVATEDVVYLLNGLGIQTGIDLQKLAETGQWITQQLQHPGRSKAGLALTAKN
jgi:hydroxymethylglutaryl-CoA lyase